MITEEDLVEAAERKRGMWRRRLALSGMLLFAFLALLALWAIIFGR